MTTRLTPEQRAAIEAHRYVALEDEQSHERFYLVPEASFLHLQGLAEEEDRACQDRLRQLIREGIDSPDVPATDAFNRLRHLASELARENA